MIAGLKRGIDLFNRGDYWEAHEAWEQEWMPDRKGPDAGFYKGLIQVSAGCDQQVAQRRGLPPSVSTGASGRGPVAAGPGRRPVPRGDDARRMAGAHDAGGRSRISGRRVQAGFIPA